MTFSWIDTILKLNNIFKKNRVYFDHASAKSINSKSLKVFVKASKKYYANGSSIHEEGEEVREVLHIARKQIAKYIRAKTNEIYFTSSTTEANNIFIQGVIKARLHLKNEANDQKKPHIITSLAEHSAILNVIQGLDMEKKITVTYLTPKENGVLNLSDIKDSLQENTVLMALSHVNSENGSKQNIREISKIIKGFQIKKDEKTRIENSSYNLYSDKYQKIYLFIDATQSIEYENIDVNNLGVDGLSFGSHKIGGPAGAALLYIRHNTKIENIFYGGGQEGGLKHGSENVPAILGFVEVMKNICEVSLSIKNKKLNHISELKAYFIKKINDLNILESNLKSKKKIEMLGDKKIRQVKSNNKNIYYFDHSLPQINLIHINNMPGEEVLLRLNAKGIAVSTATACSLIEGSGSNFLKSQSKEKEAKETIRISFSEKNTKKEIDILMYTLQKIIEKYS